MPSSPVKEEGLKEQQAKLEQLATEAEELQREAGTDLVPAGRTPAQAKRELAALKVETAKRAKAIEAQSQRVKAIIEKQARAAERQMQQAMQALEPMREMMEKLEEGIWTVNLYLGTREQIVQLADGKPADADTVITIRQLVLSMDQECAVAAETGGIDALDIEQFDEWLKEDHAHVEQVLPEEKGVVALVPREGVGKDYGNPRVNVEVERENKQTYLLIRNGERLYRVMPDLVVGERLIPAADEFTKLFEKRDPFDRSDEVKILKPGSREWERAAKRMEARERHYMRVALVLQGLADRTTVFHPLPPAGISFLERQHYTDERVRFILDAERQLGTGREPFRDWQGRLIGELRVGMRVVGDFRDWGMGFYSERYEDGRYGPHGHRRLHPSTAEYPKTHELHTLEVRRPNGDLIFRYPRGEMWDPRMWVESLDRPGWGHYGGYRVPKQRASCIVREDDEWIIPFDLVTREECESYLRARTERHAYIEMFPLLKAVVRLKHDEEKTEKPFRRMLAGVIARENDVKVAEAQTEVGALVEWWKLKNRNHRPLVGKEADNEKAVRMIVAEHRRRLDDRNRPIRHEVVKELLHVYPEALLIVRPRRGGYLVLLPAEPTRNVYVHEVEYTARGECKTRRDWQLIGSRPSRWTVAYEGTRWAEWNTRATHFEHLRAPERKRLGEHVKTLHVRGGEEAGEGTLLAITYDDEEKRDEFIAWVAEREGKLDEQRPLTSRPIEPDASGVIYGWCRTSTGGIELLHNHFGGRRVARGWSRKHHDYRPTGWAWDEHGETLYRNRRAIEKLEADRALYKRLTDRHNELEDVAAGWHANITAQWIALRERDRYHAFLNEYSDPELWEGHVKTLREIRWPEGTRNDELWAAAADAVERGVPIEGREAGDLVADFKHGDASKLPDGAADLEFGDEPVQGPWNTPDEDDDEREECVFCGEKRDPFEFKDGLRCVYCAEEQDEDS